MGTSFDLRNAPTQKVLAIRESCAFSDIGVTIGRLLPELMSWASQHDVRITGPAFARYSDWKDGRCTVEAGFVIDHDVITGDARVHGGTIGGGTAVFGVHVGPYSTLAQSYAEMDHWIKAHGYVPGSSMYEEYLDPPTAPATRTELWWPVATG